MTPDELRCAAGARLRQESMAATAGAAARLLLIEVDGPWGRGGLQECRLDRDQAARVADAAAAAGVRVQLIRRPGRQVDRSPDEAAAGPGVWSAAVADLRPGSEAVRWHTWRQPVDLLEIDLRGQVLARGAQEVALVCAHGRHDVCCALEGRPVAAALAAGASGWDVWETSHVGGHRFAANLLLLPAGDLFGGLDAGGALAVLAAYRRGVLVAAHHRGRFGLSAPEQAALHQVRTALGEQRRHAVRVEQISPLGEQRWEAVVLCRAPGEQQVRYRVNLSAGWSTEWLSCADASPSAVLRFAPAGLTVVP